MAGKRQVFAVGDITVDVLLGLKKGAKFGEEQALDDLVFSVGGNAANFAVVGSKLGFNPKLVSILAEDFVAPFLRKELAKAKVSAHFAKGLQGNAFSIVAVKSNGERAIHSMKQSLSELTASQVSKLVLPALKKRDIVFFGGFFHLAKLRPGFKQLLSKIKKRGAVVCFDTCFDTFGKWKIAGFLPFIDYLFVNEVELKNVSSGSSMRACVERLFKNGATVVVVKQGRKGATLFAKHSKPKHFNALSKKAVDTTGAGDAFNAGFVFGLLNKFSLGKCVLAGNFVASRKIKVHGLAAPNASEVARFVK